MNNQQIIEAIAEKAGLTKADASKALDAMIRAAIDALKQGDSVKIDNIGTLFVRTINNRLEEYHNLGLRRPVKNTVAFRADCPGPHIL